MKFTLEIECDNAAFEPDAKHEISRILRTVVRRLENGTEAGSCMDANGNRVGSWEIEQ